MYLKEENIMTKECLGCGSVLQTEFSSKEGFIKSSVYDKSSYCERCFKIMHYIIIVPLYFTYIITQIPVYYNIFLTKMPNRGISSIRHNLQI